MAKNIQKLSYHKKFNRDIRTRKRLNEVVRLDAVVQHLLNGQFSPRQARLDLINEVWNRLLPIELSKHCEILCITGEQLKVQVDSPSYLYELQLCSPEILKELQSARIQKIKFVLA